MDSWWRVTFDDREALYEGGKKYLKTFVDIDDSCYWYVRANSVDTFSV